MPLLGKLLFLVFLMHFQLEENMSFSLSVEDLCTKPFVVQGFIYNFKPFILVVHTLEGSVLKNLMHVQLVSVHWLVTE